MMNCRTWFGTFSLDQMNGVRSLGGLRQELEGGGSINRLGCLCGHGVVFKWGASVD